MVAPAQSQLGFPTNYKTFVARPDAPAPRAEAAKALRTLIVVSLVAACAVVTVYVGLRRSGDAAHVEDLRVPSYDKAAAEQLCAEHSYCHGCLRLDRETCRDTTELWTCDAATELPCIGDADLLPLVTPFYHFYQPTQGDHLYTVAPEQDFPAGIGGSLPPTLKAKVRVPGGPAYLFLGIVGNVIPSEVFETQRAELTAADPNWDDNLAMMYGYWNAATSHHRYSICAADKVTTYCEPSQALAAAGYQNYTLGYAFRHDLQHWRATFNAHAWRGAGINEGLA